VSIILLPLILIRLAVQSTILALGRIWANRMRSILTTTGIVIGVASVTAVIAGLTGLKSKVLSEFESIGTNRIFVNPNRPDYGPMKLVPWQQLRFLPEQVEGLKDNCPSVDAYMKVCGMDQAVVSRGQMRVEDAEVLGFDSAAPKVANRPIIAGRTFSLVDDVERRQVCIITPDLRDRLLLDRDCVGQSLFIGDRSFTIVGIVSPPERLPLGGQNGALLGVYVPFSTAYKRGAWLSVQALAKSSDVVEEAQAEITFFLRRTRGIAPGDPDTFRVDTVGKDLDQFRSISGVVTAVAAGIVGISLVVGGIGIMNIMLVSVSERTREIGLRKAVGARSSAILLQFLVEAVVLCLVGGVLGLAGGFLLTKALASIPNSNLDTASIPVWAAVLSLSFSAAVGLFFGVFPAIRAASLDPIVALKHE
jgi:putative ABC transport system permease protein